MSLLVIDFLSHSSLSLWPLWTFIWPLSIVITFLAWVSYSYKWGISDLCFQLTSKGISLIQNGSSNSFLRGKILSLQQYHLGLHFSFFIRSSSSKIGSFRFNCVQQRTISHRNWSEIQYTLIVTLCVPHTWSKVIEVCIFSCHNPCPLWDG